MSVAKVERPMSSTGLDYDRDKATEDIKKQALAFGADEVSIGNIERWEGAPIQMDPKQIMPECKSIIAMSFRVMRGSMRGIEEGTFFSNYSAMGYGGITYLCAHSKTTWVFKLFSLTCFAVGKWCNSMSCLFHVLKC